MAVAFVNFDPSCETTPYEPDLDVRNDNRPALLMERMESEEGRQI